MNRQLANDVRKSDRHWVRLRKGDRSLTELCGLLIATSNSG
ncbi:MAG: hypothetical protein AAGD25_33335 [Cyanobacteria bacterium P01_F01_bin.150]